MGRLIAAVVFLVVGVATPSFGQQGTSELRGRIVDAQGAVLPGASVVARHQESGLFRETTSGADGSFFLTAMTPGTYEVTAELASFKRFQQRDIRLEVGRTTTVDVQLELGAVQESITVSAQASLVDTTSKELGGYVRAEEINDVPSFNRNFTGYLGMLPGVVAGISTASFGADSINVNGQAVQNVNYTFDGSNNNDTFNGGNGGAQARIPVEAVQEFQLLTSQFDAEFGNASGALVNAVSKTGTNQLRGSGFLFFQDDAMTTRDYFARRDDLPKPPSRQHQWGGTLGGPVIRDRAHFFFSLERILLDSGITINVPPRPEFNRTDFEITRVWNYLARFDHQINANNTWGVRWLYETSPQSAQWDDDWTPTRLESETDVDWTLVGTLSSVLSSTKVNTFRLSGTREDVTFGNPGWFENGGRQDLLLPLLDYLSFQDQQSPRHSRRLDVAYAADETFAWFIPGKGGDHDLKFGAQYIWASLLFQQQQNMNGTFVFNHDLPFNAADPRTYPERLQIRVPGESRSYMPGHFLSGFAQDKWRVNNRLSLTLGVRYDLEILPLEEKDNPRFASQDDYPVDTNNFSPRLGFSYAMDSRNQSVLRGGFGVFFQRTPFTYLDEIIFQGAFSDSFVVSFPANNVDPGPSRGQFPADSFLVNGPILNRGALNSLFAAGTLQRNAGTAHFDNPDRHLPYSRQYSIGYERQLFENMSASLDYIRSEQRDMFMRMDLNPGLRDTTARTSTLRRRNAPTFVQDVRVPMNVGWNDYDALQLQVEKRFSNRYAMRGSYTWSRSNGVSEAGVTDNVVSQLGDDLRLDQLEGPASVHRPHILSTSGTYDVSGTRGLKVSGVLQYRSATPFSMIDSTFDLDRNGSFINDYLPAGTYNGQGPDAITVENKGGRRGARTDGYFKIDFRAGYRLRLPGNRTLDAFLDVFNITNHTNFDNPLTTVEGTGVADRRAPNFLVRQGIIDPVRTAQLNLRYAF
jgi:hypothetical protein